MKNFLLIITLLTIGTRVYAQDLMEILDNEKQTKNHISSTFKGTRIINGHSIENREKGTLEFIISHRFGRLNSGIEQLYGLDESNIRFAFEYGLSNNVTLGVGRSSFEKTYDGFIKYKLVKQSTGANSFPVAISLFGSLAYKTLKNYDPDNIPTDKQRLFYTSQILIARKFNSAFSFQITPTYIHRNSVKIDADPHDIFAVGFGNRIKLNKRVTLNTEYFYTVNSLKSINTENSLAIGIDIETGGHVFQIMLSNAVSMIEKGFITETTDDFFNGDIHLGFNISRAFQTGNRQKKILEEMKSL
jgi:Membrane bound beta barrel domain (DUF5777)